MWARTVEAVLGCWLAISPFIFRHAPEDTYLWAHDFTMAGLVFLFAVLSWWQPTRYAHAMNIVAALWLVGGAYFLASTPAPAAFQNHVMVGLILLMFAIVPNDAEMPSTAWLDHYERQGDASWRTPADRPSAG